MRSGRLGPVVRSQAPGGHMRGRRNPKTRKLSLKGPLQTPVQVFKRIWNGFAVPSMHALQDTENFLERTMATR